MKRLYYLGQPADGFGWGVANTNLVRELGKLCDVIVDTGSGTRFDAPAFVPVTDSALNPLRKIKRCPRVMGYCFTEWPLTEDAKRNARLYDVLFTGSTWNTNKLLAAGIKQAHTLIQGVDFDRFPPQPPSARNGFVVYSGGKYELRKGQDIVLAAMRTFMKIHGDAVLLAAWHNPWAQSAASMTRSWLIDPKDPFKDLPQDRVMALPPVPNDQMPAIYRQAHIGLFPNRCEAGTNMVLMEFMASGRPVIATHAHGHTDMTCGDGVLRLPAGSPDPAGWANPNVSDVLSLLERAYTRRDQLSAWGAQCRQHVEQFTWAASAQRIFKAAFCGADLEGAPAPDRGAPAPVPSTQSQPAHSLAPVRPGQR